MEKKQQFPKKQMTVFLLILAILVSSTFGSLAFPRLAYAYTEKGGYVSVGSDLLNVRSGPGTSYDKIGTIRDGSVVTVIGEATASDGALWYQIRYSGSEEGYVHSTYIILVDGGDGDADFEASIAGFPESYKPDLRTLHALYPNWKFVPVETGLDWETSVDEESVLGKSLIATGSVSSWKSTQPGAYDWNTSKWVGLDGPAWVQASREITAYFMDPRNYLDSNYIFVFLDYSYDPASQVLEGLQRIVKGTFLAGDFTENDTTYHYPEVIMDVAAQTGMNPYVMATMINLEIGSAGTSNSISGTLPGYEGLYNYYNVGAYATDTMTAIERGLWFAGKTGSTSYNRPWDTRYKAILGGAQYYANNYVKTGQNTLYLKKFNVTGNPPYTHQYMTNVQGASSEAWIMSKAYDSEARGEALVFKIPIYENMPGTAVRKPTGDGSPNNKLASLTVNGYNLTPAFDMDTQEYDVVVESDVTSVVISAAPKDGSASVHGTGVYELTAGVNTFEIVVTAENGQQRTYEIHVAGSEGEPEPPEPTDPVDPTEPTDPEPTEPSEDPTATLNTSLNVSDSEGTISGFPAVPMEASAVIEALGVENGSAAILTAGGDPQAGKVGTGNVVQIFNANGELQSQYTVIVYGDANGDGKISSADLLRIQKGILGLAELSGVYRTAADANHDGRMTSADLLKIQKTILGQSNIAQ